MTDIESLLGDEAKTLLEHTCSRIPKKLLHAPGPDFVDRVMVPSDRGPGSMRAMQQIFNSGRLGGTGYVSMLPVDQGIEHSAGASFAPNPIYFDPANIIELAIEGGCNCVASSLGVLGSVSRRFAHRIPFMVKLNHNETLTLPAIYEQTPFAQVEQAFDLGALAVGATVYFGSRESRKQISQISEAFYRAHELGMVTVLWAYLRNSAYKKDGVDYHLSADLTGQANHIASTIQADIVKQKLAENNGGYNAVDFGHTHPKVYSDLTSEHPVDLVRYQVANCFMGRAGLINSGGGSGDNDLAHAVRTAVINKRGGGMGLISGRKAFQKPMIEGAKLLHAIQNVYLNREITIA